MFTLLGMPSIMPCIRLMRSHSSARAADKRSSGQPIALARHKETTSTDVVPDDCQMYLLPAHVNVDVELQRTRHKHACINLADLKGSAKS